MTAIHYISIFIAIVIMVLGLTIFLNGLRNRKNPKKLDNVTYDKNGIPIIPRHERDLYDEDDLDDAIAGETTIAPDRSHLKAVIDDDYQDEDDYDDDDLYFGEADEALDGSSETIISETIRPDSGSSIFQSDGEPRSTHSTNSSQQLHEVWHGNDAESPSRPSQLQAAMSQSETTRKDMASGDDDLFSSLASATESLMPVIETAPEPEFDDNSPLLDQHLLSQADNDQNSPLNHAEENVNITLVPKQNFITIDGQTILGLVKQYGLRYGAMNMFHRYENKDGTGILWFSMMGMTKEGIAPFDLNTLPTSEYKGLVLFLSLPHPKALQGFDSMMSIVGLIAKQLDTHILDENNEPLTRERKQQLRNQVQEYQYSGH